MLRTSALATICGFLTAVPAAAQRPVPDSVAYRNYRLTETTLRQFAAASRAILTANEQNDIPTMSLDDAGSVDGMASYYDRVPALRDALRQAGIGSREYILFMVTAFQAGVASWLVERSGWKALPHNVARENVEFYQRHEAELAKLNQELAELRGEGEGD